MTGNSTNRRSASYCVDSFCYSFVSTMKFVIAILSLAAPSVMAFAPSAFVRTSTALAIGKEGNVEFGGNTWKPDSEKMGSTDTGDYFPDDYDPDIAFGDGMMGSQNGGGGNDGPQLPGMENLGEDAIMMGGIEVNENIPEGMEFIPSSVPDGEISMDVAASGKAGVFELMVKPVCMTFEDFYAAFSTDSHKSFSVTPSAGRMDRRGGEITQLTVICDPRGQAGTFTGDLVINLPEDNSKMCYKVTASCF